MCIAPDGIHGCIAVPSQLGCAAFATSHRLTHGSQSQRSLPHSGAKTAGCPAGMGLFLAVLGCTGAHSRRERLREPGVDLLGALHRGAIYPADSGVFRLLPADPHQDHQPGDRANVAGTGDHRTGHRHVRGVRQAHRHPPPGIGHRLCLGIHRGRAARPPHRVLAADQALSGNSARARGRGRIRG